MEKVRSIDFANLALRDALDFACLVEEEAQDRYGELADQMDIHHNHEVARFFRFMVKVEAKHGAELAARRQSLFGDEPRSVTRNMLFDVEAPDYDEARANMTVRQALEASLRAEEKAYVFFDVAVGKVLNADVRELFSHLRADERQHQELVRAQIAKLPPESDDLGIDVDVEDDPVAL